MKGMLVRTVTRPDPQLETFKQGFWSGFLTLLFLIGLLCSTLNVTVSLP